MKPPQQFIDLVVQNANESRSAKSKRGVVIFQEWTNKVWSEGRNDRVDQFCTGSEECKLTCRDNCIHAEEMAVLRFMQNPEATIFDSQLVHIKTVDSKPVPGGPPSCLRCARPIRFCGIAGVWLLEADGWKLYDSLTFLRLSRENTPNTIETVLNRAYNDRYAATGIPELWVSYRNRMTKDLL